MRHARGESASLSLSRSVSRCIPPSLQAPPSPQQRLPLCRPRGLPHTHTHTHTRARTHTHTPSPSPILWSSGRIIMCASSGTTAERTMWSTCSGVPPLVALDSAQHASRLMSLWSRFRIPTSSCTRFASMAAWICSLLPAITLETAQHASFFRGRLPESSTCARETRAPWLIMTCVCTSSPARGRGGGAGEGAMGSHEETERARSVAQQKGVKWGGFESAGRAATQAAAPHASVCCREACGRRTSRNACSERGSGQTRQAKKQAGVQAGPGAHL